MTRIATQVIPVEYCGECPFSAYRNYYENGSRLICTQLTDEDKPLDTIEYVPAERRKDVRPDCPLPND